jgi:hypothetical protein
MKLNTEAIIKQHMIEVTNKETGKKTFLYKKNEDWKEISEEEYNKILGDTNGK